MSKQEDNVLTPHLRLSPASLVFPSPLLEEERLSSTMRCWTTGPLSYSHTDDGGTKGRDCTFTPIHTNPGWRFIVVLPPFYGDLWLSTRSQGPSGMEPTFHTTARQVSLMSLVFLKKPNSSVNESLVPGPFRTHWFSGSQGIPTEVCVLGNQMEAMFTHFFCSCGGKHHCSKHFQFPPATSSCLLIFRRP